MVACDLKPDIILANETWCNNNITNATLQIDGYDICPELRQDRKDTKNGIGGGLLCYVRPGLSILSCDTDSEFNQYSKFILKTNQESMNFFLIYRPPGSTQENTSNLVDLIKHSEKNSFFIGDFNLPDIDWSNLTAPNRDKPFLNTCLDNGFEQLVNFPTHIKGNILDLVLTNNPESILSVNDCGSIGKSDHSMLLIEILCENSDNKNNVPFRNWKKANYEAMKEELRNINWTNQFASKSTSNSLKFLTTKIEELTSKYVPTYEQKNGGQPPWMTRDVLRAVRKKKRLWKKYRTANSPGFLYEYKEQQKRVKTLIRKAKNRYEKKISCETKNKRIFNSYLKSKLSCKSSIGPLKNKEGNITNDESNMAEILNEYFSSVFTNEDLTNIPEPDKTNCNAHVFSTGIDDKKIKDAIKKMKPSNSTGPDGISVNLLQKLENELTKPLKLIFLKSISSGEVPQDWKDANVIPIFKKGGKSNPGNYRPISLTSIVGKLLETLIKETLMDHLLKNELIRNSQHGFLPNKSCATNLLEFLEYLTKSVDEGNSIDILYLDFAKAFDKVPHKRLLAKIKDLNINGNLLKWIENWLTGRRQRVVINGKASNWKLVLSGVPQGSVLGPICFIIFINDLDLAAILSDMKKKFADDTKILKQIRGQQDQQIFQECIESLVKWSKDWGMEFNNKKCKIMHIGKNNPKFEYKMDNDTLDSTSIEKDIGVHITSDLKPTKHCEIAANKARAVLGQISKSFHFRDRKVFVRLYKTYVRPHLEFSVSVWNPYSVQDIRTIENIQIRAVNMVSGLTGKSYSEKLSEIGMMSLKTRRKGLI